MQKIIARTATTTEAKYFRDPNIPARRGRNEWEANRRWRQCLENELIGRSGCTSEEARASVRSQRPWLYEQTDAAIAAHPVPPTREENFFHAYLDMGYSPKEAGTRYIQRIQQDDKAVFTVNGCTDLKTAKATLWLIEAAEALCAGDMGRDEAIRLIEMARKAL